MNSSKASTKRLPPEPRGASENAANAAAVREEALTGDRFDDLSNEPFQQSMAALISIKTKAGHRFPVLLSRPGSIGRGGSLRMPV
jgi:hypothetical protein